MGTGKATGSKAKFHVTAAPLESYTARSLYDMKFQDAAKVITRMDTMMKAYMSTEAQGHLDCLYEYANRFGNDDYEACDQPSISQFRGIMGKIKHWETIMYWLLEIDVLFESVDLQRMAEEAERDIEASKNGTVLMNAGAVKKAEKAILKASVHVPRTQEIIDQAAMLTAMFSGR